LTQAGPEGAEYTRRPLTRRDWPEPRRVSLPALEPTTMRIFTTLALLATLIGGVAASAHAWSNCTTSCSSYGGQTNCTRSCF
jgi:hypothetical protein